MPLKHQSPLKHHLHLFQNKTHVNLALTSKIAQAILDTIVEREKVVQSRFSQRSWDDINELFQVMFPGHKIIEKFSCDRSVAIL